MPSCGFFQRSAGLQSESRVVSPCGCYGVGKIIQLCVPPLHFKVILRAVDAKWCLVHTREGSPGHLLSLGQGCGAGCLVGRAGMEASAGDGLGCRQQISPVRQRPGSWPRQVLPHEEAAVLEILKSVLQIWRQYKNGGVFHSKVKQPEGSGDGGARCRSPSRPSTTSIQSSRPHRNISPK